MDGFGPPFAPSGFNSQGEVEVDETYVGGVEPGEAAVRGGGVDRIRQNHGREARHR